MNERVHPLNPRNIAIAIFAVAVWVLAVGNVLAHYHSIK